MITLRNELRQILDKHKDNLNLAAFLSAFFRVLHQSLSNGSYEVTLELVASEVYKDFVRIIRHGNDNVKELYFYKIVEKSMESTDRLFVIPAKNVDIDEYIVRIKNHPDYSWNVKKISNYFFNYIWLMLTPSQTLKETITFNPLKLSFEINQNVKASEIINQTSYYIESFWRVYVNEGIYDSGNLSNDYKDSKLTTEQMNQGEKISQSKRVPFSEKQSIPPFYQLSINQTLDSQYLLKRYHEFVIKKGINFELIETADFVNELRKTEKYKNFNVHRLHHFLRLYYPIYKHKLRFQAGVAYFFEIFDKINVESRFNFIETVSFVDLNQLMSIAQSLNHTEWDHFNMDIPKIYLLGMNGIDYVDSLLSQRKKQYEKNIKALLHIENQWENYFNAWEKVNHKDKNATYFNRFVELKEDILKKDLITSIDDLMDYDFLIHKPVLITRAIYFLKFHQDTLVEATNKLLFDKLDEKQVKLIIMRFCEKHTLEEVGKSFNLTRERVRQIVKKYIEKLSKRLNHQLHGGTINRIIAKFKSKLFISYEEIKTEFGFISPLIVEVLKLIQNPFNEFKELGGITPEYSELNKIYSWIRSINFITDDELEDVLESMQKNLEVNVSLKELSNLFSSMFIHSNGYFFNSHFINTRSNKVVFVVAKHFSEGIRVYDDDSINKFIRIYIDYFGKESFLKSGTRIIGNYITRYTKIIDRGTYAVIDEIIELESNVIDFLIETIQKSKLVYIERLFNLARENFDLEHIKSKEHFASVIKKPLNTFYNNRFYYATEAHHLNYQSYIVEYIQNAKRIVSNKELLDKFPGLELKTITNLVNANSTILTLNDNKYMTVASFKLSENEKKVYSDILRSRLDLKPYIHIKEMQRYVIFNAALIAHKDINEDYLGLHKILEHHFDKDYKLHYPFIGIKETFLGTIDDMADYYIVNKDVINLRDVIDFYNDYSIPPNTIEWIKRRTNRYYQVSDNQIMIKSLIQIDSYIVSTVERILQIYFKENPYSGIDDFKMWNMLPKINIEWNKYLVHSLALDHFKDISLHYEVKHYNNLKYRIEWGN